MLRICSAMSELVKEYRNWPFVCQKSKSLDFEVNLEIRYSISRWVCVFVVLHTYDYNADEVQRCKIGIVNTWNKKEWNKIAIISTNMFYMAGIYCQHTNSYIFITSRWCHNGCDSVSIHQPHDCLLNRLFRRRSKKTSKLRATGLLVVNSPHNWPVTQKMFPFDDVIMKGFEERVGYIIPYTNADGQHWKIARGLDVTQL